MPATVPANPANVAGNAVIPTASFVGPKAGTLTANTIGRYYKVHQCIFFAVGVCKKGIDCRFAHGNDQRALPDLKKTQFCASMKGRGWCEDGPFCRFAHGANELRRYRS